MTGKIKIWQWPNMLAIDASLIAVTWLWVFSREQLAELSLATYAVLAMSVWLTYISDRLFDAGPRDREQLLSSRHQFAKQRARTLWSIWAAVLIVNLLTAFTGLNEAQLQKGFVLLALCLAYTALNYFFSKWFFPKELLVALIFTGGIQVFLPEVADWPGLISFALLCLINCLCIGWKEASIDSTLRVRSLSSISDTRCFYPLTFTAACFSVLSNYPIALLPSIICLLAIQIRQQHFSAESFRVLCDVSLLFGPLVYFLYLQPLP